MSCQQVPRLAEDPYTFTDTAPTTATLFNPQIHKLTPISNQTDLTKPKFQQQKAQTLPQSQRIFSNQPFKPQTTVKIQQPQLQHQHQQTVRINGTNTTANIVNGVHNKNAIIVATESTNNSTTIQKPIQKILHFNNQSNAGLKIVNNSQVFSPGALQIPTSVSARKYVNIPLPQSLQKQQLPQIVSLNQSQPLYSVAKQSQVITCSSTSSPTVTTTTTTTAAKQNFINPKQSATLIPPLYQMNKNQNHFQTNIYKQPPLMTHQPPQNLINSFNVQQIRNHSKLISNINFPKVTSSSIAFSTLSVNPTTGIQNQILTASNTPTSQPLPVSNFAQPQQIKQLAFSSSSVNSTTSSKKPLRTSVKHGKVPGVKEPKLSKKQKLSSKQQNISVTSLPSTKNERSIFLAPKNAKIRDTRILSTGSVGSGKLKNQNKLQLSSAARTRRAYSQTSHHEALQRISNVIKSEWHAPESYTFDLLGAFTNPSCYDSIQVNNTNLDTNDYFFEHSKNCDSTELNPVTVQTHWLQVDDIRKSIQSWSQGREKRIELRKAQLRRQAMQYIYSRKFISPTSARKRLVFVSKTLKKLKTQLENNGSSKKCCVTSCDNMALALSTHCYLHITKNSEQHLFVQCSAKFSDHTVCRIPVFDIEHEVPLCAEHSLQNESYLGLMHEEKPKKISGSPIITGMVKKRNSKSANMVNTLATSATVNRLPIKRNKKKRKPLMPSDSGLGGMDILNGDDSVSSIGIGGIDTYIGDENENMSIDNRSLLLSSDFISTNQLQQNLIPDNRIGYQNDFNHIHSQLNHILPSANITTVKTVPKNILNMSGGNYASSGVSELTTQEIFSMCENSSTYESSEDTGVGGLSETELIGSSGHDVIEEIPLGDTRLLEEHDLTNVLNQLPEDAFNELFTTVEQNGPHEPTQEEQEYLERALEMVNKQVKSLEQMAGDQLETNFLDNFLDVDECQMLDDSDICTEDVLHSPDTSGIETSNLLIDGGSNSVGSCSNSNVTHTPADLRNLVHTK